MSLVGQHWQVMLVLVVLGDFIFNGLALFEPSMIITATILVTAIALIVNYVLSLIEKWVVPKGLKVSDNH